jgi:NitT/TauT family transport system substrate-binding protein
LALLFSFSSVTAWSETARQLRIGVQFGLGYLPLYVAMDAGFFERRIREEGLDSIPVEFSHLAGAPQVNDGLLSQSLEIGSGGYTAMMVYCEKTRAAGDSQLLGVAALSAVPYELFTVDPELRSLKDLDPGRDKIGLPSVKVSVPAIYLQMAAEQLFGPGNHGALDPYTVSLAQPDGVISLLSGGTTVNSYLFSPPFSQQVEGKPNIHKVWSSNELFDSPATALVTWTTVKFHRENPKLIAAFVAAMRDAMRLIAQDPKQAAAIYLQAEKTKLSPDFIAQVICARIPSYRAKMPYPSQSKSRAAVG